MSAAAITSPSAISVRPDPLQNTGFLLMGVYFFLLYSRVAELIIPSLHLPMMLGIAVYSITAITGGLNRAISTPQGKLLIALTGLMIVSSATGIWIGGSLPVLTDVWFKSFPFYFVVVGLVSTTERCFGLIRWFVSGVSVLSIVALVKGENVMGRLIVDNSRFGDPNDLALVCVMAFPLWAMLIARSKKMKGKLIGFLALMPIGLALTKTGSRGGMLALMSMIIYIFWKVPIMRKVQVLILSVLVVILGLAFLPPEVSFRYISMFTENMEDGDVVVSEAEREASKNSSENRIELLKNSLIITAKHPLLGVGPGNFPVAENDLAIASGERKGQWHVTHNMYTQISSEVGIPAAICYLSILAFSFRYLKQIQKLKHHPEKDDLALAGFWVRVALIGFSAGGFFLSVGYVDILPLLAGISAVLMKSAIAGQTPAPVAAPVRTAPRLTPQLAPAID